MPNFFRLSALWILFLLRATVLAGGSDTSFTHTTLLDDVHDVFRGVGSVYSAPLQWDASDWILAGDLASFAVGAFLLDSEFRTVALHNQNSFGDRLNSIGNFYGQARYALIFAAGTYAAGLITRDHWIRGTGIALLQTLISAGALNLALKTLVGRSRPYVNNGNVDFHPWAWEERFFSLPSGHTVVAFSISSVLAERIKNTWATIGLYSLASVTAWSRMYSDDHWFSDVVLGAAFTTTMGISLVRWYEEQQEHTSAVKISPSLSGVKIAVMF